MMHRKKKDAMTPSHLASGNSFSVSRDEDEPPRTVRSIGTRNKSMSMGFRRAIVSAFAVFCFGVLSDAFVPYCVQRHNKRCESSTLLNVETRHLCDENTDQQQDDYECLESLTLSRRRALLVPATTACAYFSSNNALAFEGGVGGLGKTKPETGVVLMNGSVPIQNSKGIVSAELVLADEQIVRVEFATPWPLLPTTTGLEARNLQQPESAFVQVVESTKAISMSDLKQMKAVIIENVLGSRGKFGAYYMVCEGRQQLSEKERSLATFLLM